jgi:hypothetical protein
MSLARLVALATLSFAVPAMGITIPTGDGPPILLDITNTADFDYHFYQGNGVIEPQFNQTKNGPVPNPLWDPTYDRYYDWLNKLDVKLGYGSWHAELRVDSALFWNVYQVSSAPVDQQRNLLALMTNRFINNLILEKVSASYLTPNLEVTLGDFYINYGRGIVLTLRKVDQLGVDTTLRGLSVTGRLGGFSANVAGGVTNNINTDQATASVAPDAQDPVLAARLEYRQQHLFAAGLEGTVFNQDYDTLKLIGYPPLTPPLPPGLGPPFCTPQNDCKLVSIGPLSAGQVGALASNQFVTPRLRTENLGGTLDFPQILEHASAYFEFAHQWDYLQNVPQPTEGNAFYGGVNVYSGPVTVQAELKDYRNFRGPVQSSLQPSAFPAFYQQTVYTNPPNLEEIWQEEISTNPLFIWGPRLRVDWQINEQLRPYAVGAVFVDAGKGWNIYYGLLGVEANWQEHRGHLNFSGGARYELFNQYASYLTPPPNPYEYFNKSEWWVQYDIVQPLSSIYSLELDGLHRTHKDCAGHPNCQPGIWNQGYAYLSLKRTSITVSGGLEYYTLDPTFYQPYYFNASASWIASEALLVRAFVGGREAGLRCINGICRLYPGFNGINLEVIVHY